MHAGQGTGLSPRDIGQSVGVESVTLNTTQLPTHRHDLMMVQDRPNQGDTSNTANTLTIPRTSRRAEPSERTYAVMRLSGESAPHENMQPTLCINYIIALRGSFPSRN